MWLPNYPLNWFIWTSPSWHAQFVSSLLGYDLMGFIAETSIYHSSTLNQDGQVVPNMAYTSWVRQYRLLLHVIFDSLSKTVMPLVAFTSTSNEAWQKLIRLYANNFRSWIMNLKDKLSFLTMDNKSVSIYLQVVKCIVDEFALINS